MRKTGYHYTVLPCWKKIKEDGLKPYTINRPDLWRFPNSTVRGIWIWQTRHRAKAHVGSLLYQMSKGYDQVAFLKVRYDMDDRLTPPGEPKEGSGVCQLLHSGELGRLRYHMGHKAWIITKPIPPERIELIKIYNFKDAFK